MTTEPIQKRLRALFAAAGVEGWLHARPMQAGPAEVAFGSDQAVPMSSLYKLPVLVAYARMVDAGQLDPTEAVTLDPDGRTPGPTGVAIMSDPVTMSWRDLVTSMIAVSDNAAAHAVLHKVGIRRVTAALQHLGLFHTTVTGGVDEEFRTLLRDTSTSTVTEAFDALANLDRPVEPAAYDPLRTSASTGRDMTRLLCCLWTDTAASPDQCRFARTALSLRSGPPRLRAGFAVDGIHLADKTGTLGVLRHDVGVVQFPGEDPYAVAVFTRAARTDRILPAADAVIGTAARAAIDHLRHSLTTPG